MKTTSPLFDIIQERLSALEPSYLDIVDDSDAHIGHGASGAHVSIHIESPLFTGQTTVKRHRMIYNALTGLIGKEIHAVQITAKAP